MGLDHRAALAQIAHRLQAVQIGDALDAFSRETADAEERPHAVGGDVAALADQTRGLIAERARGKSNSAYADLGDAAAAACATLKKCAARMRELDGAGAEACTSARFLPTSKR